MPSALGYPGDGLELNAELSRATKGTVPNDSRCCARVLIIFVIPQMLDSRQRRDGSLRTYTGQEGGETHRAVTFPNVA